MFEMASMTLGPFGRSDETLFLAIPAAKYNSALRLPAGLQQFADSVDGLEHARRAARRINGPKDPGVAVIPGDHPFVGVSRAIDRADHVPDGAIRIVLLQQEMDLHPARAYVVWKPQPALPILRHRWSGKRLENRLGVLPGDRGRRNRGLAGRLFGRNALRTGQIGVGGNAGRGRVAGVFKDVLYRAALHSGCRAVRPVGINGAFTESIVGGIAR